MRRILVDTGAFFALADRDDAYHGKAEAILKSVIKDRRSVFTTNYIVAETHALILSRLGHKNARMWLKNFNIPVEQAGQDDQRAGRDIILRHRDKKYSLVDAISFAVMDRLNSDSSFTFDPHFAQYGFKILEENR